jgi:hypothetical protein
MSLASLIQLIASCIGVIGSIFFAIGIIRQSVDSMAQLSGTYWDANPHLPKALAAQKADYLFGGGLITLAFVGQLSSFFVVSSSIVFSGLLAAYAPWLAVGVTILGFFVLRFASRQLAAHYEQQIWQKLERRSQEA